jgi:ankyrin repeat protein
MSDSESCSSTDDCTPFSVPASPNIPDETDLIVLIKRYSDEQVIRLVESGYPLTKDERHNHTPLYYAVYYGLVKLVRLMLERGASVDNNIDGNQGLVEVALRRQMSNKIAKLLIEAGADIIDDAKYIFRNACYNGDIEFVKYLFTIYKSAGIDDIYESALIRSISNNHVEIVQFLIENGVDLNKDKFKLSNIKSVRMCDLLIDRFGVSTIVDGQEFQEMVRYHDIKLVIKLVKLGANINEVNKSNGNNTLYYAIDTNSTQLVMLMLDYGADMHHQNKQKVSPLRHAKNIPKFKHIYRMMVEYEPIDIKEPEFD